MSGRQAPGKSKNHPSLLSTLSHGAGGETTEFRRTHGHLKIMTAEDATHLCSVSGTEVPRAVCEKKHSDPLNAMTTCRNCNPPSFWKIKAEENGGNGGIATSRKISFPIPKKRRKKAPDKKIDNFLAEAEADEAAALLAQADMEIEQGEEMGIVDSVDEEGQDPQGEMGDDFSSIEEADGENDTDEENLNEPVISDSRSDSEIPEKELAEGQEEWREVISPILEGNVSKSHVNDFQPDPDQPRQEFSPEAITALGKSLLEYGQVIPILAFQDEEGRRIIIDGESRWRACREMKISNIYDITVKNLKLDKFLISTICNLSREGHTYVDQARAVSKTLSIIERTTKKSGEKLSRDEIIRKIADGYGKSTAWVYQRLSISRLGPNTHKLLREEKITLSVAVEVSKADDQAEQFKMAQEIVTRRMSAKAAICYVKERIKKHNLSSITRKTERSPKDDYRILRSFANRTIDDSNIILSWGPGKIIGLFYNREDKDKKMIVERLDRAIAKLKKIRTTVHNEDSIGADVKPEVQKLWKGDDGE
jgi:ParB family chromosome partitioning protein